MDGWIIPMIAGLLLDVIGAYFIVQPLLRFYKDRKDTLNQELDHTVNERDEIYDEGEEEFWREKHPNIAESVIKEDREYAIEQRKKRIWEKESIIEKRIKHEVISYKSTMFGLVLLSVGFSLQILANIIQWINETST